MTVNSTLSQRGRELEAAPSLRDRIKRVSSDPYDPDTNPGGFVNIGVSENFAVINVVKEFVNKKVCKYLFWLRILHFCQLDYV